jgi:hypothetical protein
MLQKLDNLPCGSATSQINAVLGQNVTGIKELHIIILP